MRFGLFDYQAAARDSILRALGNMTRSHGEDPSDLGAVVLTAPTGAGKTVIATAVIEAALDGDGTLPAIEGATFLWVTDDPSLNAQTIQKMDGASSALKVNRLIPVENTFHQEVFDPGKVYFLNIQKLSASATLSKGGGDDRRFSLWDTISNTIARRPGGFFLVIDEAHRGMSTARATRETIVSQLIGGTESGRPAAPVVWGISATPRRFRDQMMARGRTVKEHTVPIDDVRESGLLKDQIVLGHTKGADAAESTLLRHATSTVRQYEQRWRDYCTAEMESPVDPVLVVQVPDRPSEGDLAEIVGTILDSWPEISAKAVIHTFASHAPEKAGEHVLAYCPPEDIQDRRDIRVVLCKTAITTGWDCPRAEVLVSFRVARDSELITQIMGRMVRTPLARRVATDLSLNSVHCILPRFDAQAVEDIADQFEAGDDSIAGGTEIVRDPVQITRNPQLSPSDRPDVLAGQSGGSEDLGEFLVEPTAELEQAVDKNTGTSGPTPRPRTPDTTERGTLFDGDLAAEANDAVGSSTISNSAQDAKKASSDVFEVLERITSYTIPRRLRKSNVSRAFSLGALLAENVAGRAAIESTAPDLVRNILLGEMENHRANLATKGILDGAIAAVASTRLYEQVVAFGSPTDDRLETVTDIELDQRGIGILFDRASRLLPEGLVAAFVNRIATEEEDVTDAQILAIALASDAALREAIEQRASALTAEWLKKYHSAITRLSAAEQERYDRIRRDSDVPLETKFSIPMRQVESSSGDPWERHVLAGPDGVYRASFGGTERHVLETELKHGIVAWYRNPPNSPRHSLIIPYTRFDGIHGLAPDFIFIDSVDGELRPSIVDPHGSFLADALPKLQGMVAYARRHGPEFHRLQVVDRLKSDYLMLDLNDPAVQEAVLEHSAPDASGLFEQFGVNY